MIVIDTHILLWWASEEQSNRLSVAAKSAMDAATNDGRIFISSASAWEIGVLVARQRIGLSKDVLVWLETIGRVPAVQFVPVDNTIAIRSTRLPGSFHKDPGDRYIVATALQLSVPLVTADEKILAYPHVRTIW